MANHSLNAYEILRLGVANAIATGTEDSFFSEEAISRYLNAGLTAFATGGLTGGVRTTFNKKTWETIDDVINKDKTQKEDEAALNAIVDEVDGTTPNIAASDSEHNGQTETIDDVLQEKTISPARQELHDAFGEDGVAALEKTDRIGFVSSQEEAQKVIDETEDEMRFSRENTFPWPDDFPKSTLQTNLSKLKNHPDYKAAKAGDMEAAQRVIASVIKPEKIKALKQKHPNAIVVAPHAEESSGRNALPETFAKALGRAGFSVDRNIVQTNRPQRTKKGHELRLAMRPEFDGKVEKGREYILLDDAVGQGGTASELRFFIEKNGGKVVGFSHLAAGRSGGTIAVQKPTLQKLKEKFGDERLNKFLDDFNIAGRAEALTEGEAKYLLKQSSLNSLRDRIFKSAQERNIGLQSWGVRSSLQVKYSKDGKIQGFVLGGKTYLVEDGIPQGHAKNVLHHEVGTHVRQLLFKDEHFKKLLSTLERRSKNNTASGKALRRAMARVPEDTPAEHYWEEVAAYVVEDTANASIIREIIALIKKAVNDLLGGRAARLFNEKDLRALAQVALKREVKEVKKEGKEVTQEERDQQQQKGEAALKKLLQEQKGEVLAMHHPELGDVYFVYGETGKRGYGIAHLIEQREKDGQDGKAIAQKMPEVIAQGEIVAVQGKGTLGERVRLSHKNHTAVLSLYRDGEKKVWLLTGWENEDGGAGVNPATAYTVDSSGISHQQGASKKRVNNSGESVKSKVKFSKAKTAESEKKATEEREKTLYQNLKETFSDHPFSASIKEKYPDLTLLEKIFSVPEYSYRKSIAAWNVLQAHLRQQDLRMELEDFIFGTKTDEKGNRKGGFVLLFEEAKKNHKKAYELVKDYLVKTDKEGVYFRTKFKEGYAVIDPHGKVLKIYSTEGEAYKKGAKLYEAGKKAGKYKGYTFHDFRKEPSFYWELYDLKNKRIGVFDNEEEATQARLQAEQDHLKKFGYSDRARKLILTFRKMTDRAFDKMVADLRKLQKAYQDEGLDAPTVPIVDESKRWALKNKKGNIIATFATREAALKAGNKNATLVKQKDNEIRKEVDFQYLIAEMNERRGGYFPRQRQRGEVIMIAKKGERKKLLTYDFFFINNQDINPETGGKFFRRRVPAFLRGVANNTIGLLPGSLVSDAKKLEADGWTITRISKQEVMPETVFEAQQLLASVSAMFDSAIKDAERTGKRQDMLNETSKILMAGLADMVRKRGFLSSRIHRSDDHWEGYEEDPLLAGTSYGRGIAAGIAKRETSERMMAALMGRDKSFEEWKEETGKKDKVEYEEFTAREPFQHGQEGRITL